MVFTHRYSRLIDPSVYSVAAEGLPGDIPLRVHRQVELADRGALRAQRDWERAVGPLPRYAGIMSRDYNFVATCLPEGLPDRIELSAYVTETAFLLDDAIDAAESPLAAAAPFMADLFQARLELKKPLDTDISGCTPVVKLVVGMGRAMLATDTVMARHAFQWVKKWATQFMSHPDDSRACLNFEEYLEYRRVNVSAG